MASRRRSVPRPSALAVYSGRLERDQHVRLSREIVDLVGLRLLHDANDVGGVGHIAVMQVEGNALLVRIVIEVVDARGVERGRSAFHAVNSITLGEQQLGQISAVLTGRAGDQRYFPWCFSHYPFARARNLTSATANAYAEP